MSKRDHVVAVCHEVGHLSRDLGLTFSSIPTVQLEFHSRQDYYRARLALMESARNVQAPVTEYAVRKAAVCEVDVCNVTFRFVCSETYVTPSGTFNANGQMIGPSPSRK
jgi:hypothetical protein